MVENIQDFKPEDVLVKAAFKRAIPSSTRASRTSSNYDSVANSNPIRYEYLSQSDFLREYDQNAHKINSIKYYPNRVTLDADHKQKIKVRTRVAIAWQKRIHTKRLAALTGNDCEIKLASSQSGPAYQASLNDFKEGWDVKSMENAIYRAIRADGKVGDAAIIFYKDDNGVFGWKQVSYDNGDTLYPHYDPMTGRMKFFGRKFSEDIEGGNTVEYLEVYSALEYMRYRLDFQNGKGRWEVDQAPVKHGFSRIPVAYHRYGEPFWSASQSLIEQDELAMSQLAENNAQYALRILYALGAEMEMESSVDGTPTAINSTDPNAKVGFLEPADSSKSFELELTTLQKDIMRCSFTVETPEIKSGSDVSSLTVKMLFADSYQKALDDAKEYQPFLDEIVSIFKEGYGTETGKVSEMAALKVRISLTPWVFMSDTEVVNTLVQLTGTKILSRRSASQAAYEILGYGTIDEADVVAQQEHDDLLGASDTLINEVNIARNNQ